MFCFFPKAFIFLCGYVLFFPQNFTSLNFYDNFFMKTDALNAFEFWHTNLTIVIFIISLFFKNHFLVKKQNSILSYHMNLCNQLKTMNIL